MEKIINHMNKTHAERFFALINRRESDSLEGNYGPCIKDRLVLHGTSSGQGVEGDLAHFALNKIGTPLIIERTDKGSGIIRQLYNLGFWRYHLGITKELMAKMKPKLSNAELNGRSLGVELDNWGALIEREGKYYSYTGKEVKEVVLYEQAWRKSKAYEKYTDEQIRALEATAYASRELYGIDLTYHDAIFEHSDRPYTHGGIYAHSAFVPWKADAHPQAELVQMLKSLKND